jgi:hypothetical protein
MTEAEWRTCNDIEGLLRPWLVGMSSRKRRLFACGCCRQAWHVLTDARSRRAVEAAEDLAEGRMDVERLTAVQAEARRAEIDAGSTLQTAPLTGAGLGGMLRAEQDLARAALWTTYDRLEVWNIIRTVAGALAQSGPEREPYRAVSREQCNLLREILGNPVNPVRAAPSWLHWNDDCVVRIARSINDGRRYHEMPILADALIDAGCTSEDLIAHCRSESVHQRGCWALDLLTGKE